MVYEVNVKANACIVELFMQRAKTNKIKRDNSPLSAIGQKRNNWSLSICYLLCILQFIVWFVVFVLGF